MLIFKENDVLNLLNWLPGSKWHWGGFNGPWNKAGDSPYNGYASKKVLDHYLEIKIKDIDRSNLVFDQLKELALNLNKYRNFHTSEPNFEVVQKSKGAEVKLFVEVSNEVGDFIISKNESIILEMIGDLNLESYQINFKSSSDKDNKIGGAMFDIIFHENDVIRESL